MIEESVGNYLNLNNKRFDLDLSNKPYKTMRFHERTVRSIEFHEKYPLFGSCSDDGNINK